MGPDELHGLLPRSASRSVIESKRKRRKIEVPEPEPEPQPVPDLMEALERRRERRAGAGCASPWALQNVTYAEG